MDYNTVITLLGHDNESWQNLIANGIRYSVFQLPKANKKLRLIEAPQGELKRTQKYLNNILYAEYHPQSPDCVHGFIRMKAAPRNILSNARTHLGKKYLINIDLKDFYHQITTERTTDLLWKRFPNLLPNEVDELNKIVVKDDRLPMGAPTSSVLSNMAFQECDMALMTYCDQHKIVYTRYVDDLSFSSNKQINSAILEGIYTIIKLNGFSENPKKVKHYGESDVKIITGIAMQGLHWHVSDDMKSRLEKNMSEYRKLRKLINNLKFLGVEAKAKTKLKTLKRAIAGQLEFVKQIEGIDSDFYRSMKKIWKQSDADTVNVDLSVYI
ncbi:RNA-directed DNA polymerase [Spirosomataceae bacterium TFI 002]|nr:RNA-directed DNA polymerase [Spirosomataceae bacterium TFI 002]